jgi:hypothetical protein
MPSCRTSGAGVSEEQWRSRSLGGCWSWRSTSWPERSDFRARLRLLRATVGATQQRHFRHRLETEAGEGGSCGAAARRLRTLMPAVLLFGRSPDGAVASGDQRPRTPSTVTSERQGWHPRSTALGSSHGPSDGAGLHSATRQRRASQLQQSPLWPARRAPDVAQRAHPAAAWARGAVVRPIAITTCDLDPLIALGASPFPLPVQLGHECVAEVLAVGQDVATIRPGQRVVVPFQINCGSCTACRAGHTSNCTSVPPISMRVSVMLVRCGLGTAAYGDAAGRSPTRLLQRSSQLAATSGRR